MHTSNARFESLLHKLESSTVLLLFCLLGRSSNLFLHSHALFKITSPPLGSLKYFSIHVVSEASWTPHSVLADEFPSRIFEESSSDFSAYRKFHFRPRKWLAAWKELESWKTRWETTAPFFSSFQSPELHAHCRRICKNSRSSSWCLWQAGRQKCSSSLLPSEPNSCAPPLFPRHLPALRARWSASPQHSRAQRPRMSLAGPRRVMHTPQQILSQRLPTHVWKGQAFVNDLFTKGWFPDWIWGSWYFGSVVKKCWWCLRHGDCSSDFSTLQWCLRHTRFI